MRIRNSFFQRVQDQAFFLSRFRMYKKLSEVFAGTKGVFEICNITGKATVSCDTEEQPVDTSSWLPGVYFVNTVKVETPCKPDRKNVNTGCVKIMKWAGFPVLSFRYRYMPVSVCRINPFSFAFENKVSTAFLPSVPNEME